MDQSVSERRTRSGRSRLDRQGGLLMVEMLVAIVVVSVALVGVTLLYAQVMTHGADPIIRQQSLAVARSYLDEILAQPFCDPQDAGQPAGCQTVCPTPEVTRDLFDNVCDYQGLVDVGVHGRDGVAVTGMEQFTVSVSVSNAPSDALGPGGSQTPGGETLRVDVTVSHAGNSGLSLVLSGYRTPYGMP